MNASEPEVVVIGGGILGLFVALLLAEDGYEVRTYVAPDPDPHSESQRNQSWLHSGLFYTDNIEIARRLFYSGGGMHEHLGRRRPPARGLFRFTTEDQEQLFLEHAGAIRLRNQIESLSDRDAALTPAPRHPAEQVSPLIAPYLPDVPFSAGPGSASPARDPASEAPSDASGGGAPAPWDAPIQAHFEDTFKDMDERAGGPRR